MRILYIDIDSLRPDHLGCYGYHRNTSPNIDRLASQGTKLAGLYASDTPCLPSRTTFFGGHFGTTTGVVNHGGVCADLQPEGVSRGFRSHPATTTLAALLSQSGYHTASISPFPRRHSAYQITHGFHETHDTGKGGLENADEIYAVAKPWLIQNAKSDNWFLHINFWDPHTPYDTPASFGNPFTNDPIDPWLTQGIIDRQRASYGPHSAREVAEWDDTIDPRYWPWGKGEICNLQDAKVHIDGYDCGVAYVDHYIGLIIAQLDHAGVLDETAIIVSADHGENLGELNVWGDHQLADECTNHIPAVIKWPGVSKPDTTVEGLHYNLDLASTIVDLASPKGKTLLEEVQWEGQSMAESLRTLAGGRTELYLSHGAWSLQRSLRWDRFILIHTLHSGIKDLSEWMLFDLQSDLHETTNLACTHPELVKSFGAKLSKGFEAMIERCPIGDPFEQVLKEGGPYHAKTQGKAWDGYLQRLRDTGRGHHAEWLEVHQGVPRPSDLAAY